MTSNRNKPNWGKIEKCHLWPILGITECDNCIELIKCWGTDCQLSEPALSPEQQAHWEQTLKNLFTAVNKIPIRSFRPQSNPNFDPDLKDDMWAPKWSKGTIG